MKTILKSAFLFVFLFNANQLLAQTEMLGNWNASCFLERAANGSLQFSMLCPVKNTEDNKGIDIKSFDMHFKDKELILTREGVVSKVKYTETHETIDFQFEKDKYTFKVLRSTDPDKRILKTVEGAILLLERK